MKKCLLFIFCFLLIISACRKEELSQQGYIQAIRNLDIELIKKYIERGFDIEEKYNQNTPLSVAVRWGNPDTVKFFLEKGADPNYLIFQEKPFGRFVSSTTITLLDGCHTYET